MHSTHHDGQFFSCDWGTTAFRLRHVSADGNVIGEVHEPSGVRALLSSWRAADGPARESVFADFLRAQLLVLARNNAGLLAGAEVVISGMASSSVGWRELPYARTPLDLDGSNLRHESFDLGIDDSSKARVHMISGVRTDTDVMRGEETEILGAFADGSYAQIAENGIVVLPGTHSKHVRLCDCQLASFQTYMTGELFDVLSTHSLLRASIAPRVDKPFLGTNRPRTSPSPGAWHTSPPKVSPQACFKPGRGRFCRASHRERTVGF